MFFSFQIGHCSQKNLLYKCLLSRHPLVTERFLGLLNYKIMEIIKKKKSFSQLWKRAEKLEIACHFQVKMFYFLCFHFKMWEKMTFGCWR